MRIAYRHPDIFDGPAKKVCYLPGDDWTEQTARCIAAYATFAMGYLWWVVMKYSALFDNGQEGGIEEINAESPEAAMDVAAQKVRENCTMSGYEEPVMVTIRDEVGEVLSEREAA